MLGDITLGVRSWSQFWPLYPLCQSPHPLERNYGTYCRSTTLPQLGARLNVLPATLALSPLNKLLLSTFWLFALDIDLPLGLLSFYGIGGLGYR